MDKNVMEKIIGNKEDVVYIGVDKEYKEEYIYTCTNGYQGHVVKLNKEIAEKLIPLLKEYLKHE